MKREFSFYEFVGILIPGVTLLFFAEAIIERRYNSDLIDFAKVGESVIFIIISYGIGHILHSIGNIFESILWKFYGGLPTEWLIKKNRFGFGLFDDLQNELIRTKVIQKFGERGDGIDYGRDVYNWLSLKDKITEKRIDIFNANYSLFRGLTVTFYLLAILVIYVADWRLMLIPFILGLLANIRMVRFSKLYATEIFRTYHNCEKD